MKYNGIITKPKFEVTDKEVLSLVYTPGVGAACKKIEEDTEKTFDLTNRENSVAVISSNYRKSLERAIFLKSALEIDAYPFEISDDANAENLKFVVENIEPNFCAFDLSLISDLAKKVNFEIEVPVLIEPVSDLKSFFLAVSKNQIGLKIENLSGDLNQKALELRELSGGVIETQLNEEEHVKPVAILSDGSAVLGFGEIGEYAAIPVMEGKAVLFKELGNVDAISLCVKTKESNDIIKIAQLLKNSFSGINLEDIKAPKCFEIEDELKKTMPIPIFHDDQHGTAIVVLAGLLNALSLTDKKIEDVKIVFSGAGAAATAVSKLILNTGVKNIIHTDIDGVLYSGRRNNTKALEELAQLTNPKQVQGTLNDVIKGADVFIGLSAANILTSDMIKHMADKPIVFALANPVPEIMPDEAKDAGAYVVATGRSDYPNQLNNSLAFPGLFKGILESSATQITDEMKLECAFAIASCVKDEELNPNYIIPDALDSAVVDAVSQSVSKR
ncbi:hypothetical protein IJS77_02365 [bacterium]|nr:hypothetical protein [bacterium]